MEFTIPKKLGRPSNRKQVRYIKYHNDDDKSDDYHIIINTGEKKLQLKNVFLYKMLPDETYVVNPYCNVLLGHAITDIIPLEKIVNLSAIIPLPENNASNIPSNEVNQIPTNVSGNNDISNSENETQNTASTNENNENSTNTNQNTQNVENNDYDFGMLDIFNSPPPSNNINGDIDFPCILDTDNNFSFSNFNLEDFDFYPK